MSRTRVLTAILLVIAVLAAGAMITGRQSPAGSEPESEAMPRDACPALYLLQNVTEDAFLDRRWSVAIIEPSETAPSTLELALESSGLVLAYVNAGFAEEWRPYYVEAVQEGIVHGETPWYEGEHYVEYWADEWLEIVASQSLALLEQGYQGVYLDNIDAYKLLPREPWTASDPRTAMKNLVCSVSSILRQSYPQARIYVNIGSGTELLSDDEFTACIDGVLREELWHRWNGTVAEPVPEEETAEPLRHLEQAVSKELTVIIVDPVESKEQASMFCREALAHGFFPAPHPAWDPDYSSPLPKDWCACP